MWSFPRLEKKGFDCIPILKSPKGRHRYSGLSASPWWCSRERSKQSPRNFSRNRLRKGIERKESLSHSFSYPSLVKDLEKQFPEIGVRLSYKKFRNHCKADGRHIQDERAAFTNWLLRDQEKGWNLRQDKPQTTAKRYCPEDHEEREIDPKKDYTGVFCSVCGNQMVDDKVYQIIRAEESRLRKTDDAEMRWIRNGNFVNLVARARSGITQLRLNLNSWHVQVNLLWMNF